MIEIADNTVKVVIEETAACTSCPACGICRAADGKRYIEAFDQTGARIGDTVLLELPAPHSLLAAMLFFGLPVLLGLIGLIITSGRGEIVTVIVGSAGFGTGLLIAKLINDMLASRRTLVPRIIEIIHRDKT